MTTPSPTALLADEPEDTATAGGDRQRIPHEFEWGSLMAALGGVGAGNLDVGQAPEEPLCVPMPAYGISSLDGSTPPVAPPISAITKPKKTSSPSKSGATSIAVAGGATKKATVSRSYLNHLKVLSLSHSRLEALPPCFAGVCCLPPFFAEIVTACQCAFRCACQAACVGVAMTAVLNALLRCA